MAVRPGRQRLKPPATTWRPLVTIVAAAFVVKAIVLAELHDHPLLQPQGDLDSGHYMRLAQQVASGDLLLGDKPYFVSPLYIYFLAATLLVDGGGNAFVARLAQIALGAVGAGLIAATADLWAGRRAAIVAGALACATGLFTFYEVLILQAALDPFLTALALYLLARALIIDDGRWFALAGLMFGLLALNRPNALPYAVFVCTALAVRAVWHTSRAASMAGAFTLGLVLAIAPVTVRNYVVSGEPIIITSHGGLNFYIGNHPDADGTYTIVPGITPSIAGQAEDAERLVAAQHGRNVTAREVSDYFYGKARQWIAAYPARAAGLFVRKLAYVFNSTPLTLNYSYTYYSLDEPTLLRALVVGAWLLVPLGLLGVVLAGLRRRAPAQQDRVDVYSRDSYLIWAAFVPIYALSVAAFFVSSRYRLPLLVPLTIASAAAIDWIVDRARARDHRRLAAAAACAVPLFLVANWNYGLDDGRAEERTQMLLYLIESGRSDEALRRLPDVEASHAQPALLLYRVGRALQETGRPADAITLLERAQSRAPRPEVGLRLGQALLDAGRAADALPHLQRAVDAGAGGDVAIFDAARALAASGQRDRAAATLRRLSLERQDVQSASAIATLALGLRALDVARAALERTITLDASNATAHLNLAVIYAEEGRLMEARTQAQTAVRLRPGYEQAVQLLEALRAELREP